MLGQQILDKAVQRIKPKEGYITKLLRYFKLPDSGKLWLALGKNNINNGQLNHALKEIEGKNRKVKARKVPPKKESTLEITVAGTDNILTHFAQCCQPHEGDALIGFVTHANGISIHKTNCENVNHLSNEQKKQLVAVTLKGKGA